MTKHDRDFGLQRGAKGTGTVFAPVRVRRTPKQDVSMWALLVWAYKRQLVHYGSALEDGDLGTGSMGDALSHIAALGCRVDHFGGGGKSAGSFAHEDAFTVHERVETLPRPWPRLIAKAAHADTLPDWLAALPGNRICREYTATGRPAMKIGDGAYVPNCCVIRAITYSDAERKDWQTKQRAKYKDLRKIIHRLALYFYANDELRRYRVRGVGIKNAPWCK